MSDRSLRGMRLGSQSKETEEGVEPAPRQVVDYTCPNGHETKITFSVDADIPEKWNCKCGQQATITSGQDTTPENINEKTVRTHWDMLLERRTPEELEKILEDRLEILRNRRKTAKMNAEAN
ncbi:MAG: RNA polymerase-binding protein RbpA [Micrococcaceae bacterium]